ncbi:hypothetical protein LTR36_002709 [Oleoguttula mirabilis]|uniref:Enoyl reductase (ER) domain-containing protein n=1 Tax=Oleoguttula mirabilis TaxID=1507867 RepID=A0AAV9JK08_9PEZI|nr:hypothetical protein LTR36_002709 [Oleoguttula mirabilis]
MAMTEPIIGMKPEFILGHEGAGEIVQLGSDVSEADFQVGERIGIHIVPGCDASSCLQCNRGLHRLCRAENSGNYGLGYDGTFAEYIGIQTRAAIKLPAGVDVVTAAVSGDAVLTAYQAVKYTAAVQPHQTIAIFGLGGLGLNALQIAQHLGVKRILVVDRRQESIDEAIKLGIPAEDAFCTSDPDVKKIEQVVAEQGILVDTTIDFAGAEATILSTQLTVRPAGQMVIVGLLAKQAPLMPMAVVMKAITIKGSYSGTIESFHECLELMAKGVVKPTIETGSIEDLPKVLKDLDEGKIKSRMVLLPDWKRYTAPGRLFETSSL